MESARNLMSCKENLVIFRKSRENILTCNFFVFYFSKKKSLFSKNFHFELLFPTNKEETLNCVFGDKWVFSDKYGHLEITDI